MTAPESAISGHGTILVVDDEPDILVALEDLFEDEFRVLKANSPIKALEILAREPDIAIIISDQRMPEMQGDEFLAKARAYTDAEAILLTGYADLKAVIGAVNNGRIMAYVPKPWDPSALSVMVKAAYERHRMARELDRERLLLRGLMESTQDLISFKDVSGRFIRLNGTKAAALRVDPSEAIGRLESEVSPSAQATDIESSDRHAVAAGIPTEQMTEHQVVDGAPRWTVTHRIPILDNAGRVQTLATIERDVTERRMMEMRLRQADKMQALGTLAGGIAHDFNNLLMAVLGSLDLASRRLPDDPRLSRLLQNAIYAAERGASLTQRLLSFSRQRDLKLQAVDVNGIIVGMNDLLTRTLGGSLRIERKLTPEAFCAVVDPDQLELAVLNLCINARDAMPEQGLLTLSTRNVTLDENAVPDLPAGQYVVVAVADNGSGMPPEVLNRVFEPFFTTKEVGKGTGLGLPMVYGLAQQAGGAVTIDSVVGQGTTVELYLRRSEAATRQEGNAEPTRAETGPSARVLLVDDDPEVRGVTSAYLHDIGHKVTEATDAAHALQLIGNGGTFDLLVADFAMPGMTGLELASHAREKLPEIEVLLVTGYADPEKVPEGYRVLNKPFSRKELSAELRGIILGQADSLAS
jgi:PAS domain S-box-containing protein